MTSSLRIALSLVVALTVTSAAAAPYKIVAHPRSPLTRVTKDDVARIFLKKATQISGSPVVPVERPDSHPSRDAFCREILGKSPAAVKAFWQQRIFSGRDLPPMEKVTDAEAIDFVKATPNAITYVAADADTTGLKVLLVE